MIYETLQEIQSELKAPKGQYNSFGKYKYRSCEDILEAVKPILAKHKASIILSDDLQFIGDRYYIKATATLYAGGESVSVSAFAREEESKKGMDGSQVTGASSSYARKYALNGLLATDDTKDSDTTNTGNETPFIDMAYEQALDYVIPFGKYKDKTLKEIYKIDRSYISFLHNGEDRTIVAAIDIIDKEILKAKEQK